MMRLLLRNRRGFSLMEIILAAGLMTTAISIIFPLFTRGVHVARNIFFADQEKDFRQAMNMIMVDLREADRDDAVGTPSQGLWKQIYPSANNQFQVGPFVLLRNDINNKKETVEYRLLPTAGASTYELWRLHVNAIATPPTTSTLKIAENIVVGPGDYFLQQVTAAGVPSTNPTNSEGSRMVQLRLAYRPTATGGVTREKVFLRRIAIRGGAQ